MAIKLSILNISSNTTLNESCEAILVNTSGGAITITLPLTPTDGTFFYIKDKGNAGTNNITINGNGKNIDGAATTVININDDYTEVLYCSTSDEWFIL